MVDGEDRDDATRAAAPRAHVVRRWLLVAIACLYVLSVPWYRSADAPLRLVLGLPDWVFTALACYVAAAVLNAWAWWITDVEDEAILEVRGPGGQGGAGGHDTIDATRDSARREASR